MLMPACVLLGDFNPLPPHGGRLQIFLIASHAPEFQSTPSAWRETYHKTEKRLVVDISIHSLRMEGDGNIPPYGYDRKNFNPLPPHGGRRKSRWKICKLRYFNPLPPHGGRLETLKVHRMVLHHFNPLPPHGGRPGALSRSVYFHKYFNPLPPHGGRRGRRRCPHHSWHFNPLPPHGGRRRSAKKHWITYAFQSTPSAWRETSRGRTRLRLPSFQSTPSAWRETRGAKNRRGGYTDFNPLPPHGGRRLLLW